VFQWTIALTTRLRPEARKAWLSKERSRISPRSWKKTARLSLEQLVMGWVVGAEAGRALKEGGDPVRHQQHPEEQNREQTNLLQEDR
jgi:hypothetical protein